VKLLFDQNLARDLVARLVDIFPSSQHVTSAGLERASDRDVWGFDSDSEASVLAIER
jgi:predicted nuclease of predicted toxin-antitoxin system